LVLRLGFIRFHPANRVCLFLGANLRIVLASASMHSFHEFHISDQADPETCGWRNIGPRATQGLTYGHTPNQTYATKHVFSSAYSLVNFRINSVAIAAPDCVRVRG
jgi:hypothetical protein